MINWIHPELQVLKRHYEDSLNHRWLKGDKFRSLIDEEWWEGKQKMKMFESDENLFIFSHLPSIALRFT